MIARALGKSCTMVLLRPPYAGDIHAARANGFLNCIAVIGQPCIALWSVVRLARVLPYALGE
jgi:hypothetical protein